MIDLSRHIEYQLLYNDLVEVPLLGTFRARYVPSVWVEEESLFLPPCRRVSYSQETVNGEEFLKSLSAHYNISDEEAGMLCMEFVEDIKQDLRDNGSSEIGSIGCFVQENDADNRVFVPCEAGVASPSLYGLDSLCMIPLEESKQQDSHTDTVKHRKSVAAISADDQYVTIRINRKLVNYAATMVASVLFFVLFTTPTDSNVSFDTLKADAEAFVSDAKQTPASCASHVVAYKTPAVEEKPTQVKAETDKEKEETATLAAPADKVVTPEPKVEKPKTVEAQTAPKESSPRPAVKQTRVGDEYAVVLASALSLKNAEKYAQNLMSRGYNACIQTGEKTNRVIIPGFGSIEEARVKAKQLQAVEGDEFKSVWVLKLD